MVRQVNFLSQITQAESRLETELQRLEKAVPQRVEKQRTVTRKRMKETIEQSPEQTAALERIEHLRLRLELLRNIRMNWKSFGSSLTKKGMSMRINQDAHLKHLIHFLETGKGALTGDESDLNAQELLERDLMTFEVQPTGAGKTGAFAIDIALMDVPSLTLVPFDSLLDQTKKDLVKIGGISESDIGIVGGGTKEVGCMHTIATYSGHAAMMRKGGEYAKFMRTQCKLVICDEVHHQALGDSTQGSISDVDSEISEEESAAIESERDVMSHLSEQTSVKSLKIGFTATPKGSRKHVQKYFPHCLGRVYHKEMVDAGLVVPYRIVQCDGSVYEGELEKYLTEDEEVKILEREQIYKKLAGEYADVLGTYGTTKRRSKKYPMRGMAFCTNHAECEKFAEEAAAHGLRCKIVTGHEAKGRTGQQVIDAAVQEVLKGECDLLVTVEKLATGFNCPEINAVIWARITSAAKTIQGIGRGARSFTDEYGRVKTDCTVFETDWQLKKNGKKKKGGRKPMRLADALAFNGEDPESICTMADGSKVDFEQKYKLNEDGTVEIGGRLAVGISAYVERLGGITPQTVKRHADERGLKPIPGIQVSLNGISSADAYWKEDIDLLIPQRLDHRGIVRVDGRDAVGVSAYLSYIESDLSSSKLKNRMEKAGISPIKNVTALMTNKPVEVYWKEDVDKFLPLFIDENGIVEVEGRKAVGLIVYARAQKPSMSPNTLISWVDEAGLAPIKNIIVRSGRTPILVYWKEEVDELLPKKLDDNGVVIVSGRAAVGISKYGLSLDPPVNNSVLQANIDALGIHPVAGANVYSGTRAIPVYWKDEVDASFPKRLNSKGVCLIDGEEYVGIKAYAVALEPKISNITLAKYVGEANLQPQALKVRVLSGPIPVDVYLKSEIDELLKSKGRL